MFMPTPFFASPIGPHHPAPHGAHVYIGYPCSPLVLVNICQELVWIILDSTGCIVNAAPQREGGQSVCRYTSPSPVEWTPLARRVATASPRSLTARWDVGPPTGNESGIGSIRRVQLGRIYIGRGPIRADSHNGGLAAPQPGKRIPRNQNVAK